jgi:putative inorganic carbon (hco3(-)) transporter
MTDRLNLSNPASRSNARLLSLLVAVAGIAFSAVAGFFIAGTAIDTWQVLAMVACIFALVATFIWIDRGLQCLIFLLYTQTYIILSERFGFPDVAKYFILLLAMAMITRWMLYSDEIPRSWTRPAILIAAYCFVGLGSILYAINPEKSLPISVELFKSGLIALMIAISLQRGQTLRQVIWILLIAGIFLGTLSVYQFLRGTYTSDYGGFAQAKIENIVGGTNDYRVGGPVGDPNFYAQMLLVLVPLALDRLWNERKRFLRLIALWALAVCSFTILLTYSRGGFITLVLIVITMVATFRRNQLSNLLLLMMLGLLLINVVPSGFAERMSTLTQVIPSVAQGSVPRDYSIRGRTSEMLVAWQMFSDHPLLGVGLGNYRVRYQEYSRRLGVDVRSETRQAHSLYLEIAAETGMLGIFSFGALLYTIFTGIRRASKNLTYTGLASLAKMVTAYAVGFGGYLMAAAFIHMSYPRNFWLLVGIALAIPRLSEIEIAAKLAPKTTSSESDYSEGFSSYS